MEFAYPWSLYVATGGVNHEQSLRRDWHLLAEHGVDQGWDDTVIIMQDDFYYSRELPEHVGFVTAYNAETRPGHTCPRLFSAVKEAWPVLAWVWGPPYRGRNCELWQPDFIYGMVEHVVA